MENKSKNNKSISTNNEITLKDVLNFLNENIRLGYKPENHSGSVAINTRKRIFTITWCDRDDIEYVEPAD